MPKKPMDYTLTQGEIRENAPHSFFHFRYPNERQIPMNVFRKGKKKEMRQDYGNKKVSFPRKEGHESV